MCRENEDNHCGEPKVGGMVFPGHSVEFLFSETKSFGDERMLIRTCLLKMKMSKDEESTRAERGSTFTGRGGERGAIVGTEVLVGFVRCQCPLRDSRACHQMQW